LEVTKIGIAGAIVTAVVVTLSVIVWSFLPTQQRDRYNVAFPDTAGGAVHHEWRTLPERRTTRDRVELVVRELMLGPSSLGAIPVIPEGTRLNSVVYDGETRTVFIDFSNELILDDGENRTVTYDQALDFVTRNVYHNIRSVDVVSVTINGQVPEAPRFEEL
jgi:hypothetical protein